MSGFLIEAAIRFLVQYFPEEQTKKPALFHSIRVASHLYLKGYPEYTCIAGLLHDSLEDTPITYNMIEEQFGMDVANIVQANTKNTLLEKEYILEDIVVRCANFGEDAMIVKIIDVYDNFLFYSRQIREGQEMQNEIKRCKYLADLIVKHQKMEWGDPAFKLLAEIV